MKAQVLIIGGGATGTGLARDLALRNVQCIVIEKDDINAGASSGNHGLLHSGARYVSNDTVSAEECRDEGFLLKRMAPQCIEACEGLYVAIDGDDETFISDFPRMCAGCGISCREVSPQEAIEMEPQLSTNVVAAYLVEDASIDPFRLSLENMAHARSLGAGLLRHTRLTGFVRKNGRICGARLTDRRSGEEFTVEVDLVVNATGAWAGEICSLAGIRLDMIYSKGTLLVTSHRITTRVISRLRPPSDADILVPGGTVSILGTTSTRIPSPDSVHPTIDETDLIVDELAAMVPVLEEVRYIRAYAGVRPLIDCPSDGDDRCLSRGFSIFDHEPDGVKNFITVTGGKLTTFRLMAEKTADLVCRKLGISAPCLTRTSPLPPSEKWTGPGSAPKHYLQQRDPADHLICECEMVPKSVIAAVLGSLREQGADSDLEAVALRSRLGKGSCQGTFCSVRADGYLLEHGFLPEDSGLDHLKRFLQERWKGQHPVLWGGQIVRAEFLEALHCGLLSLEM